MVVKQYCRKMRSPSLWAASKSAEVENARNPQDFHSQDMRSPLQKGAQKASQLLCGMRQLSPGRHSPMAAPAARHSWHPVAVPRGHISRKRHHSCSAQLLKSPLLSLCLFVFFPALPYLQYFSPNRLTEQRMLHGREGWCSKDLCDARVLRLCTEPRSALQCSCHVLHIEHQLGSSRE